jgi:hypothetical protein
MNILFAIQNNWEILIFLVGIIYHAIWTYFKVGDHEGRIKKVEDNRQTLDSAINELKSSVQSINDKLDILVTGYKK